MNQKFLATISSYILLHIFAYVMVEYVLYL